MDFNFLTVLTIFVLSLKAITASPYKETTVIISEWVKTEQLIGEESSKWVEEKAALEDVKGALNREIVELDLRLKQSEDEEIGATKQRMDLLQKKAEIEKTSSSLLQGVEKLERQMEKCFKFLPYPLAQRLQPFRNKLAPNKDQAPLSLRQRLDTLLSLLQSISLFNRTVSLERQEFSLEDGISREFQVLYYGLGIAYFVNESGTVAGYGQPNSTGWNWKRQDSLAKEVSTGVDMVNNRTIPRFLKLPFPRPEGTNP